jgi:hypothetical protein
VLGVVLLCFLEAFLLGAFELFAFGFQVVCFRVIGREAKHAAHEGGRQGREHGTP